MDIDQDNLRTGTAIGCRAFCEHWLRLIVVLLMLHAQKAAGELVDAAVLPRDGSSQQRGTRPAVDRHLQRRRKGDPSSPRGEARLPARMHHHLPDDHRLPRTCQEHGRPHQTNCLLVRVQTPG